MIPPLAVEVMAPVGAGETRRFHAVFLRFSDQALHLARSRLEGAVVDRLLDTKSYGILAALGASVAGTHPTTVGQCADTDVTRHICRGRSTLGCWTPVPETQRRHG